MPFIGNKPTAVPLTSADLGDGIVTSAKIANGTITGDDINSTFNLSGKTVTGVGGVLQTVFTTTSTRFSSTSDSYVATPITITITPTSSSSKIVLFMRTLINVTGDSYPRFKWYRSIGGGSFTSIITEPTNSNGGSSLGAYLVDRANSSNVYQMNVMSDVYQDFPNTTSAVIYTLYGVRENGGTFYINTSEFNQAGNTQDYNQVGTSTVLAMETGV